MAEHSTNNHYLSLLASRFREHAEQPVFRPYIGRDDAWGLVTYRDLEHRLVATKAHWQNTLTPLGLKPLSVVGLWLPGDKLSDMINGLAVSALGYIPHFFSAYFEDVQAVADMLSLSEGKALIVDSSYATKVDAAANLLNIAHFPALDDVQIAQAVSDLTRNPRDDAELAFSPDAAVGPDDIAVLFHSSGTTGGRPKIIPNTYKMLNAVIARKLPEAGLSWSSEDGEQTVLNTIGSLVHIATFHVLLGCIYTGACMVQSSSLAISPQEFVGMTRACSLNRLAVYATFLSSLIRAAKQDDTVKAALQSLRDIFHTGVALNKEDEEWAHVNGLKVINTYSTTETGPLLRTSGGSDATSRLLRPLPGSHAIFLPVDNNEDSSDGVHLFELVVPSGTDDCPPPELCDADGYYHTKDLFEHVDDGWVYRGRKGDWLKVVAGLCDTKGMEDIVRKACPELVHDVVVVGNGRAFPCMIVESAVDGLDDAQRWGLAEEIAKRITALNKTLFPHERIEDPKRIMIVDKGSLPRTREKGNIRRSAAEDMFVERLDDIYATS